MLVWLVVVGGLSGWRAYPFTIHDRIKDGESYDPAQDRRHNLNLIATYRTPGNYVVSGRFGFGTGRRHRSAQRGTVVMRRWVRPCLLISR